MSPYPFNKGDWSSINPAQAVALYQTMSLIRRVELKIEELYPQDQMKTPVHLSLGQEAVAAGVCACLTKEDLVFSNHRSHAHYLAKGGNLPALIAELYCRGTGCSRARGGSMHLIDKTVGHLGSSSIVAGSIAHAVGAALAFEMQHRDLVAVSFFGDAAAEQGVFFESMNWAVLKKLPVIFVCENNYYSVSSHIRVRQANDCIAMRARAFDMPSYRIDGMNVVDVFGAAQAAVARARKGEGPCLLECVVQRWRAHAGAGDPKAKEYRDPQELAPGYQRDPIQEFKEGAAKKELLGTGQIEEIDRTIDRQIEEAFVAAQKAPLPDASELEKYLFVD